MLAGQTDAAAPAPAPAPRDCSNYCAFKLDEMQASKHFTDIAADDLSKLCTDACELAGDKANPWELFKVVKSVLRAHSSADDDWHHGGHGHGCHGHGGPGGPGPMGMHGPMGFMGFPPMMGGHGGWGPKHGKGHGKRDKDRDDDDDEGKEGGDAQVEAAPIAGELFGAAAEEDFVPPPMDFEPFEAEATFDDAGASFM